ncbi:MAG: MerR family transcriptional regulator [Actinomycetota bacterium]|nr:MerR family transcriptional regulator [Actinomycetota bacterium]
MRTVGELSQLAGVTVRTLHHYDEIGLLRPSGRSDSGYRLYSYADLTRLQEILVWRQLGFSLTEIQALLDDPRHDRASALRRQRELVALELERLGATARALDAALDAEDKQTEMEVERMFEDFDPSQYEDEVRERWGKTDAYRESARRAGGYGEREWSAIRAEAEQVTEDFATLMSESEPAEGDRARAVAERHRQHITRWLYPVGAQMHRNLAELYIADPRFAASYEKVAPGLAAYVHDAILANAGGRGVAEAGAC